jgi:hypothetical protein
MKNNLKKQLEQAFNAGVNWKEKYYTEVPYVDSEGAHKEPDFEKFFKTLKLKKCDGCGDHFAGKGFKVYDENFNVQSGLIHCPMCNFITK